MTKAAARMRCWVFFYPLFLFLWCGSFFPSFRLPDILPHTPPRQKEPTGILRVAKRAFILFFFLFSLKFIHHQRRVREHRGCFRRWRLTIAGCQHWGLVFVSLCCRVLHVIWWWGEGGSYERVGSEGGIGMATPIHPSTYLHFLQDPPLVSTISAHPTNQPARLLPLSPFSLTPSGTKTYSLSFL